LPRTLKSNLIEEDVDKERKKNGLPPLFSKKPNYEHSQLKKSVKPECVDSTVPTKVESVTPERIDSTTYPSTSIEEIPDE
jgi:hypothetical protein